MSMSSSETDRRLEVLMLRIEQLEAEMRRLKLREAERVRQDAQQDRQPEQVKPSYYITIEHLQMEQPILEQLAFRLDSLDIKELSGSLNLGNNFGSAETIKLPGLDGSSVSDAQAGQEQSARKEATGKERVEKDSRMNAKRENATWKEAAQEEASVKETAGKKVARGNEAQEKHAARDTPAVASSGVNASSPAGTKPSAERTNTQGYPHSAAAPATPIADIPTGFNEPVRAAVWHTPVEGQEMKPVGINKKTPSSVNR